MVCTFSSNTVVCSAETLWKVMQTLFQYCNDVRD